MPIKSNYQKLRVRIIIIFSIIALSLISLMNFTHHETQKMHDELDHEISRINKAGRQRMLSQQIFKIILLINNNIDSVTNTASLKNSVDQLTEAHFELASDTAYANSSELSILFESAYPTYLDIARGAQEILRGNPVNLEKYHQSTTTFLSIMDRITTYHEEKAKQLQLIIGEHEEGNVIKSSIILLIATFFTVLLILGIMKRYYRKLIESNDQMNVLYKEEQKKLSTLQFLTNSINVGIWENDLSQKTQKWTNRFYEILGLEPDSVPGTYEEFVKLVHPDDMSVIMDASDASVQTGKPSTIDIRVMTPNGYRWVEATGNVRRNEIGKIDLLIGGLIDIHNRKILESQLKVFIEHAPAAIAMFDMDMKYLLVSKKWIETYHLENRIMIGKSHYEIFPEIGEEWKAIHQRCLKGEIAAREEDPFVRTDGSKQWIKWEIHPWYIDTNTVGGIIMFTLDVSEIHSQKDQLNATRIEAEKASKAKEEFLATMSHEIRTPLNAINGIAHILQSENPRADQLDHINLLKFSSDILLNLVNDILDMSKIQSGKLELEAKPFQLRMLIEAIISSLRQKAQDQLTTLVFHHDENIPAALLGDTTRLTQILVNLVGNAIKFTHKGKVGVSTHLIASDHEKCKVKMVVSDTGIGISQQNINKIFDSFSQEDSSITRKYGGTGLGLFITKNLLRNMESEILVESNQGSGSTFSFEISFPIADTSSLPKPPEPSTKEAPKSIHILIAEDNTANQIIIRKFLKYENITCDIANNGLEALNMIQTQAYNLVFMDLQMPEMDGYTATTEIRKLNGNYYQEIPIIALTADAFQNIKEKVLRIGMNDFLGKPFKPQDLYDIINKHALSNLSVHADRPKSIGSIGEIIWSDANGDYEYVRNFSTACIDNYREFTKRLESALKNHDQVEFRKSVHKIKALNELFELQELQTKLDAIHMDQMYLPHELIDEIKSDIQQVIIELEKSAFNRN